MAKPTFRNLDEANRVLAEKSHQYHQMWREAGPDLDLFQVEALKGFPDGPAKQAEMKRLNDELSEIGEVRDELRSLANLRDLSEGQYNARMAPQGIVHPDPDLIDPRSGGSFRQPGAQSLGQLFIASTEYNSYKGMRNWPQPLSMPNFDIRNAVFRTGAGWDPQDIRIGRTELSPQRPIRVIDRVPMLPTTQSSIVYMEETTFTNTAAETAESTATTAADLIPEAALALTERTRPVEWIPVFLPVTMQQMEDVEGIEEYVNSRLRYMIQARLDLQILRGNGTTPNLLGTNSVSGINTQAVGADTVPDAIYKLFDLIRTTGFAEPSDLFSHPNDWQPVRLLKTADGIYIWGPPMDAGPQRIWGVPVTVTTAALENTMTAGDYEGYSALYTKRGIDLQVSDSHAYYFTRGMMAIRADMRCSMVHFRPLAFGTVTGA